MFGLLKPKLLVDADEFDWLLAFFAWLSEEFGGVERIARTALVLPQDFPAGRATGHDRALEIFTELKAMAGLEDWQCDLIPAQATRESRVTTGHGLRHASQPAMGSFGYDHGRYFVRYNPALLKTPQSLVATFAHLLAHYVLHTARTSPPGGTALKKQVCDVAAIRLGFGLFLAIPPKVSSNFRISENRGGKRSRAGL